jgi:hypothetical protein
MNPYEMPSYMTVTKCLKHWGKDEFEDELLSELAENEHKLPLENMCQNGGYPSVDDWPVLEDLKIDKETNGIISGNFRVLFTEESPTGCRDHPWKDRKSGKICFLLRLASGEIEFEPPQLDKREYEPEEF